MGFIENIKQHKISFVRKVFIGLLIIMTISALSKSIVGLFDTYFIKCYMEDAGLAAVSLFKPIDKIIGAVCSIFAMGSTLLITKCFSKGDRDKGNKIFSVICIFLLGLSIIFFAILFFASNSIAKFLNLNKTTEEIVNLTSSYIKGFAIGVPFTFINEHFFQLVYLDNDKKRTTISVVVLFISNILFDFLLPKYMPDKGFAIGLASSLAYVAATLVLLTHFISKKSTIKFFIRGLKLSVIGDSLKFGLPVGIKKGVTNLRGYLLNMIMLAIGTMGFGIVGNDIVAAFHINDTFKDIFSAIVEGVVPTIIMLSNVFYSEEDEKSLNDLLKEVFKATIIVGGILSVIYFVIAPFVAPHWSNNPAVVNEVIMAMRMSALSIMLLMITSSFIAFFQGFKQNFYAILSTILKSLVFPITMTAIFAFTLGPKGIWIAEPLGYLAYLVIHFIYVLIKNKRISFNVKSLFFLNKNFGFKKDETFELDIRNIADTYQIQSNVYSFLNQFNLDENRKNKISYCAEELGVLIVVSGFSRFKKKKKNPYASMRIFYKKDKDVVVIRTRDNCNKFDIKEKIKEINHGNGNNNTDLALNCSVKLIFHMSKDVQYSQILKTNNMIIKV